MNLGALFILFISVCILALIIGHLPECVKLPCWLDFKPFNCRLCLTTWTCAVLQTLIAIFIGGWLYFVGGVIASIVLFILIWREEKKQWE